MPTSKRFEALSKRPVNMDGFVTEWPEAGIVAMRREGTRNFYYLSVDGTQWKEIAGLIDLIYASILHISAPT